MEVVASQDIITKLLDSQDLAQLRGMLAGFVVQEKEIAAQRLLIERSIARKQQSSERKLSNPSAGAGQVDDDRGPEQPKPKQRVPSSVVLQAVSEAERPVGYKDIQASVAEKGYVMTREAVIGAMKTLHGKGLVNKVDRGTFTVAESEGTLGEDGLGERSME